MTTLRPFGNRVLVERDEAQQVTTGGVLLVGASQEKPHEGVVVAVGAGETKDGKVIPIADIKSGDRIMFTKSAGTEVKVDGGTFVVMLASDVLGIMEP